MSIIDRMKGALHSVTGGGAEVTLEHTGTFAAGQTLKVKVGVTAAANELKSGGVFIDLQGKGKGTLGQVTGTVLAEKKHELKIAEGFTLAAKESKSFEADVTVPADVSADHDWEIRARVEAFGNDPDSGFKDIR